MKLNENIDSQGMWFDLPDQMQELADTYNAYPYYSGAFKWSAPGYMRAAAYLYGWQGPAVKRARILELGCASGGNSIPTAYLYPEAEIIGVDISAQQIKAGQALIDRAGLHNIELRLACISEINEQWGKFDYIIAHGLWSWIPQAMQTHVMRVVAENLKEDGLAYVSFNTYPGWKGAEVLRDAMRWHSRHLSDPVDRVSRAREMLPFFARHLCRRNPQRQLLQSLVHRVPSGDDQAYYLAHEYLELYNKPTYVADFATQAQRHGLLHLGDVNPATDHVGTYDLDIGLLSMLAASSDRNEQLQYLDFAVGRSFRQSLLIPQGTHSRRFLPDWQRLAELQFAGWFEFNTQADEGQQCYNTLHGESLLCQQAGMALLLDCLHQAWPKTVSGTDLKRLAQRHGYDGQSLLESLYMDWPVELARSYDDLPACLQDTYSGLVPGVVDVIVDRWHHETPIGDFNAWHQSTAGEFNAQQLRLLQDMDERASTHLMAGGERCGQEEKALQQLRAQLRKYAMYI